MIVEVTEEATKGQEAVVVVVKDEIEKEIIAVGKAHTEAVVDQKLPDRHPKINLLVQETNQYLEKDRCQEIDPSPDHVDLQCPKENGLVLQEKITI